MIAKNATANEFNNLVIKKKQKQINKQKYIYDDRVSKLNSNTEIFVPRNGHQNCLDKFLLLPYPIITN